MRQVALSRKPAVLAPLSLSKTGLSALLRIDFLFFSSAHVRWCALLKAFLLRCPHGISVLVVGGGGGGGGEGWEGLREGEGGNASSPVHQL
jgi:hypothetical protein